MHDFSGIEGAKSNGVATGSLAACEIISQGNRAEQTGQHNRVRRALSTSFCGVFDAAGLVENQEALRLIGHDNTTVYISFLQRVSKVNDIFYGFELHRGDGNANRVLCIGNGAEGAGYGVTSNDNVYNGENYLRLGEEDTDTHFFVIRIDFGPDNRDLVTVYRDPASLIDEPQCVVSGKLSGNFAFDRISLGNFLGTKVQEIDEIRVGTSFIAVTGQRPLIQDRLAMLESPTKCQLFPKSNHLLALTTLPASNQATAAHLTSGSQIVSCIASVVVRLHRYRPSAGKTSLCIGETRDSCVVFGVGSFHFFEEIAHETVTCSIDGGACCPAGGGGADSRRDKRR